MTRATSNSIRCLAESLQVGLNSTEASLVIQLTGCLGLMPRSTNVAIEAPSGPLTSSHLLLDLLILSYSLLQDEVIVLLMVGSPLLAFQIRIHESNCCIDTLRAGSAKCRVAGKCHRRSVVKQALRTCLLWLVQCWIASVRW